MFYSKACPTPKYVVHKNTYKNFHKKVYIEIESVKFFLKIFDNNFNNNFNQTIASALHNLAESSNYINQNVMNV